MQEKETVHQRQISQNRSRVVCILFFTFEFRFSKLGPLVWKVLGKENVIKIILIKILMKLNVNRLFHQNALKSNKERNK